MTPSVTAALRKALRQLEMDRHRIDRHISTIRSVLDDSGNARKHAALAAPSRPRTRRRQMSVAARRALSQRMKAYWAKRRAASGKAKPKAAP